MAADEPRSGADDDAAWADLVSRLRADKADDEPPETSDADVWPQEDTQPEPEPAYDDPADHFLPPPPPPPPRFARATKWGLTLIAAGLVLLVMPGVLSLDRSRTVLTAGVACVVAGGVLLVGRLRNGPPQDDGWDDGAVL